MSFLVFDVQIISNMRAGLLQLLFRSFFSKSRLHSAGNHRFMMGIMIPYHKSAVKFKVLSIEP